MRALLAILRKDLTIEGRARELAPSMAVLALLLLTAGSASGMVNAAPAMLWITLLVAASLGLARSFHQELDQDQLSALVLAPINPVLIYVGKGIANLLVMIAVEGVTLFAFTILYNVGVPREPGALALVLLLGTAGIVMLGTLLGAMVAVARTREVLLPVLLLPLAVPLLVAAVRATEKVLAGQGIAAVSSEVGVLASFALLFGAASVVLFEFVVRE